MEVSIFRLNVLRVMYLFITVGLGLTIWPEILLSQTTQADESSVISSLLGALAILCLLGLRYPLRMLPVLIFEFCWKIIWVVAFALPVSFETGLDPYAKDTLFACMIGLVLVPLVLPWQYVWKEFISARSAPWR